MSSDATIRLRVDKSEASRDLDALDRRIDQSARSAQRNLGGSGGGGVLGSLMGAGPLGLTGAGLAAQAFSPLVADVSTITGGLLGNIGRGLSSLFGLRGVATDFRARDAAGEQTAGAVGGAAVDDATLRQIFEAFLKIQQPLASNAARVESMVGNTKLESIFERMADGIDNLNAALKPEPVATPPPGAGR